MHFDESDAECLVTTFREGLLAAVGHDLTLRVGRLRIDVGDDDAVTAQLDPSSLVVVGPLSEGDRHEIEAHAAKDVLAAHEHPEIRFRSRRVVKTDAGASIDGELTLHGVTRPLQLSVAKAGEGWQTEVRLDQRDYGIKPFSTMLGALKVKSEVLVRIRVRPPTLQKSPK